jgi:hypothetical protein
VPWDKVLELLVVNCLPPSNDGDFHLCGPAPFMQLLHEGLRAWGVPVERIHYELFGPATLKPTSEAGPNDARASQAAASLQVEFAPAGVRVNPRRGWRHSSACAA